MVPTSTHVSRLIAARFQLDILHSTMLLIARSDAESARLISSSVDINDHKEIFLNEVEYKSTVPTHQA